MSGAATHLRTACESAHRSAAPQPRTWTASHAGSLLIAAPISSKLALATVAVSMPVATWWLAGSLDETDRNLPSGVEPRYDYIVRPPDVGVTVERVVGIVSVLAASVALMTLAVAVRRRRLVARPWVELILCVAISGVAIGGAGRVVTAGTLGANIGGGVLLFVLPPTLLAVWVLEKIRFRRTQLHSA
ncbi:MAG: hypothetical protein ACR2LQ_09930 [Acidimicrobiales bacterium]